MLSHESYGNKKSSDLYSNFSQIYLLSGRAKIKASL